MEGGFGDAAKSARADTMDNKRLNKHARSNPMTSRCKLQAIHYNAGVRNRQGAHTLLGEPNTSPFPMNCYIPHPTEAYNTGFCTPPTHPAGIMLFVPPAGFSSYSKGHACEINLKLLSSLTPPHSHNLHPPLSVYEARQTSDAKQGKRGAAVRWRPPNLKSSGPPTGSQSASACQIITILDEQSGAWNEAFRASRE